MVLIYVSQTSGDAIFCLGAWSTVVEAMVVWMLGGTKSLFQTMLTYRNIKHKLELNTLYFSFDIYFSLRSMDWITPFVWTAKKDLSTR